MNELSRISSYYPLFIGPTKKDASPLVLSQDGKVPQSDVEQSSMEPKKANVRTRPVGTDSDAVMSSSFGKVDRGGEKEMNVRDCAENEEYLLDKFCSDDDENDTSFEQLNTRPWISYEWTETDRATAESALARNLKRCSVPREEVLWHEANATRIWDRFYDMNKDNFFKDRHYLHKVFPNEFGIFFGAAGADRDRVEEPVAKSCGDGQGRGIGKGRGSCNQTSLYSSKQASNEAFTSLPPRRRVVETENTLPRENITFTLVDVGCGVGNALWPLLEQSRRVSTRDNVALKIIATDFSPVAIDILKHNPRFIRDSTSLEAFVWDATSVEGPPTRIQNVADVVLLLFCLSAVSPDKMALVTRHVAAVLKPGGTVLFRDYGRHDEAQMKLGMGRRKRLGENFYSKRDGTRCYYFDLEDLRNLFGSVRRGGAGLEEVELGYIRRIYHNRGDDSRRRRVWVQGRFQKDAPNQI